MFQFEDELCRNKSKGEPNLGANLCKPRNFQDSECNQTIKKLVNDNINASSFEIKNENPSDFTKIEEWEKPKGNQSYTISITKLNK